MVAAPLVVPPWAWQRDDLHSALEQRDMATVLHAVQKYSGAWQSALATATGLPQGRISEVVRDASTITALDVLERVADGLQMLDSSRMSLGLAPKFHLESSARPWPPPASPPSTARSRRRWATSAPRPRSHR